MPAAGIAPPDDGVDLASTLADATPAFARRPIPITPDMSAVRRLVLALADATPAFVPDFDARTPRPTGRRPWYRQPVTFLAALGILLALSAAALIVLPGRTAAPFPETTPPTTSGPTTPAPATSTAITTPTVSSSAPITSNPVTTTAAVPPSTTTVIATETTTVTTTVPTPTVTSTVPTSVTATVTATVTGPPVTVTNCADGTTATSPAACPLPPPVSVH